MQAYFRPELLNRLDEVVIFRQLGVREVRTVADLVLAETAARVAARGISLEVTASLMRRICDKGYDKVGTLHCSSAPPVRCRLVSHVELAGLVIDVFGCGLTGNCQNVLL